jgi:5'-deoxynucleotidase YfbR-like HD superfamily hydrolase
MATFKEQHEELQHIVRELKLVREHNLKFKQGDPQHKLLHFAEGLLVLIALERFLRVILASEAKEEHTLSNLLEMATSAKRNLLRIPGTWTREQAIKAITRVRNTLMHGNYEQAATGAKSKDVRTYFKSGKYISEVEDLFQLLDQLMRQIDPATGQPRPKVVSPYMAQ